MPYPALFAYGYPRPEGVERAELRPAAARWVEEAGLFLLPYDAVRAAPDPAADMLEFLTSTYDACAAGLAWSAGLISSEPSPPGAA
jgi:hypothetical protein